MILSEIVLGQTVESKRDAIQNNLGKQVILNDKNKGWCHGVLLDEKYYNIGYKMKIGDGRGQIPFHYHDLNQLLVLSNHPNYRMPDLY